MYFEAGGFGFVVSEVENSFRWLAALEVVSHFDSTIMWNESDRNIAEFGMKRFIVLRAQSSSIMLFYRRELIRASIVD